MNLSTRRAAPLAESLRRPARTPSWGELGRQPDAYTRAVLQSAVGHDLGDVRVHAGPAHDAVLDATGVDALTSGNRVTIRHAHDAAGTLGNRVLLLHELVHVMQQAGRPAVPVDPHTVDHLEEQAQGAAVELAVRPPTAPAMAAHPDQDAPHPDG
ncbi:DUF4157 domain-containing protein [Actinotalea sp. K2]|uniref:eCIS core domain-containing protein n=1 Tax=Actinotalea sp. K2 TaxID=2939438 RepID=UPI002017F838|nr:DUF4157 domain-containing protein [Actinotalea sp. K2]MCL3860425.1 DUF4157 domain-containing protein [Actinotalea sp. K2]